MEEGKARTTSAHKTYSKEHQPLPKSPFLLRITVSCAGKPHYEKIITGCFDRFLHSLCSVEMTI